MTPKKPAHVPVLDGLRAIAVLLVLWAHFPFIAGSTVSLDTWKVGQFLRTGYIGVDLFFVLSGFLITRLLLSERESEGSISLGRFYLKRSLRIFPIYYLCLAIYVIHFAERSGDVLSLATYTFNYYKPFHPEPTAMEHTWSLSVEEQFYLIWPFLVSAIPRRWGKIVTAAIIPLIGFATAIAIAAGVESALAAKLIYMSGPTRMISLSLGAHLAYREFAGERLPFSNAVILTLAGAAILLVDSIGRATGYVSPGGHYWCAALLGYALFSTGVVAMLTGPENSATGWIKSVLRTPPLRYVGRISYGLYLYHYVILFLFGIAPYQTEATGAGGAVTLAALLATFATASLSYEFLEGPLLRLKDRLAQPRPQKAETERLEPSR